MASAVKELMRILNIKPEIGATNGRDSNSATAYRALSEEADDLKVLSPSSISSSPS